MARRQLLVTGMCLGGMTAAIDGVVIVGVLKPFDYRPGWGCEWDRIGVTIADFTLGAGSADQLSAVREWIPTIAEDGTIPADELATALEHRDGPSSYDPRTGELRIDGFIQAQLKAGEQPGGKWIVSNVEQCFRPPS
jgi:hypothetical protein